MIGRPAVANQCNEYPLPSLGRLYSVLKGQEQLEEQLEAMFEKLTLN